MVLKHNKEEIYSYHVGSHQRPMLEDSSKERSEYDASKKERRVQPESYTLAEVSIHLSLGQTKVRDLIRHEHLPTATFGRAVRVPRDKFAIWREQREQRISSAGNEGRAT